jgi:phosphoribosyl-AMP cyclohydrolase
MPEGIAPRVKFDAQGLIPAIVQEGLRGRVLMMAWMNRRALAQTLRTGFAHFYSRSRKKLWKKGEESGHVQEVREVRLDCDGDVILLIARQRGRGACHAGFRSCFFRRRRGGRWVVADPRVFDPGRVYHR